MSMFLFALILFLGAGCLMFGCLLPIRNEKVYQFLVRLGNRCYAGSIADATLRPGCDPYWRWKRLEEVSYDAMLYQFWRPLKAEEWWDDTSFLEVQE